MARPHKPIDEQRTRRIAVYFTDTKYRAIYREAKRKGLPPALFVYAVATGKSEAVETDSVPVQ